MSPTELQEYLLEFDKKHPHNRNESDEIRAEREALEFTTIKRKIPVYQYEKESGGLPKELWRESRLYNEVKGLAEDYYKIYKQVNRIAERISRVKPEKELSDRLVPSISIFRKGAVNTQKLLFSPYQDRRLSADWIKWIDIVLTSLEQSKNYAGSKHALETGESGIIIGKDGKEKLVKLKKRNNKKTDRK